MTRISTIEDFVAKVAAAELPPARSATCFADVGVSAAQALDLFSAQLASRHLDLLARDLKLKNQAFYTIGSSGHEGNAGIASVFRHTDMAFLHYRSGAFMIARAKQLAGTDMIRDIVLSLVAAKADPIACGRHKVFGSKSLSVPPQTSTIASHLPKAVGASASIKRAQTLGFKHSMADDSVVLCSFGDASANHSTALGAFNQAQWIARSGYPLPLVFICEDNGWGISVPTPPAWIEHKFGAQPCWTYLQADGLNLADVIRAAKTAEHIARIDKKPVFLHFRCVRLLGHAGTDIETQYRSEQDLLATEQNDPLLHTARMLIAEGIASAEHVIKLYQQMAETVRQVAKEVIGSAQLGSATDIMASIVPPTLSRAVPDMPSDAKRKTAFGHKFSKQHMPLNLSQQLNFALTDILLQYQNSIVFGEDVAKKRWRVSSYSRFTKHLWASSRI